MVSYNTLFAMLFAHGIASARSQSEAPLIARRLVAVRIGRLQLEQAKLMNARASRTCTHHHGAAILLAMQNKT